MAEVEDSILKTTKKALNLPADYTAFDQDIIMHINSVFFTLEQLGLGPVGGGFTITGDEETWADYMGIDKYNAVRSYMYLQVRILFDPPTSSFALEALKQQAKEWEWRLNVYIESKPKGVTNV
ncbi:hypothetical protein SEA_GOCRAZY_5 [Arthrobacter phage GoCrazy]|uniref:Uncharacterized protein n=3 Tax=Mudcatvirus TaxID=1982088 RepID=A0AAE7SS93_9CAUD|nr:virion structural protein [Arthrobacter phage Circum]YP_010666684.1 virion structural protein [Arthrobacter phage Kardesai]YP_010666883.1 virion structural protein [Arthrobacter phage KeaneyLin]QXO13504.1 hypothetical protein SEA_GOCRAZY_5 [Arthrobacter phage GoCrazy]UYL87269.1 hypothetical protein SEA_BENITOANTONIO_6 [Arthrobacter phage BenitoAntonio]ALY08693.1 hypothetical protein CIRCUM_6 [Arthrobacter phage Circum]AXH44143.1 hypothetical protein SEA_KEANEYLIN_5 [Arthrobacter phage Kean